jgi:hypothetical protein
MSTGMIQVEVTLDRPHPAQQKIIDESKRFNVLVGGRRFGKSTLGRHLLMVEALKHRPVMWLAPTYRYLQPNWEAVCHTLGPLIERKSEEQKRLVLIGGGEIDMWSADAGSPGEGRQYSLVICDECAMLGADLQKIWERSLRPTLVDRAPDSAAWFLSTPKGAGTYFSAMFRYGQGEREDWKSWQIGSVENPFLDPQEIESARRDMPLAAFRESFLGEMVVWNSTVFTSLEKAVLDDPLPEHYAKWHSPNILSTTAPTEWYIGCDWSGAARSGAGDFCAFIVCTNDGYICEISRFRADFATQRMRLQALCNKYRPSAVLAESNSIGGPQLQELRSHGLAVQGWTCTNTTKAKLTEKLCLAFEALSELMSFEATPLANGLTRLSAAAGSHDDLVIAMLLAWEAGHRQKAGWMPQRII